MQYISILYHVLYQFCYHINGFQNVYGMLHLDVSLFGILQTKFTGQSHIDRTGQLQHTRADNALSIMEGSHSHRKYSPGTGNVLIKFGKARCMLSAGVCGDGHRPFMPNA